MFYDLKTILMPKVTHVALYIVGYTKKMYVSLIKLRGNVAYMLWQLRGHAQATEQVPTHTLHIFLQQKHGQKGAFGPQPHI